MQDKITKVLRAIADPTRREIFHVLVLTSTALPITQIAGQFEMTRQGITKHLKALESAGLVTIDSQGRERYCNANAQPLEEIRKWLSFYDKFWDDKLTSLGNHLEAKT